MSLNRVENWPSILAAHLEEALGKPFAWGAHDCVLFALDGVLRITGTDLAAPLRGRYAGLKGALRYLDGHGGTLSAMLDRLFADRLEAIDCAFAGRGDLALVLNAAARSRHTNPTGRGDEGTAGRPAFAGAKPLRLRAGRPANPSSPLPGDDRSGHEEHVVPAQFDCALAIVVGARLATVPQTGSIVLLPRAAMVRAWRV